ncbi:histidine phosphatase family protein [Nonomuraea angiospora]|uniref:Alpha-ribazole phosphatase/probable phosphoglycerate mutase n=1 Tax=Nonomuraea angiospora TaxID=46172 RepID=A0ABR9MHJ1_9ACTN|nr:histidine phosphatase family protein [Nonomuraea angiospora]MBE1592411.1 alpha-ribazole phosphatase/probable phosphoglycerate mutase [Nonomuraea angiospora]
MTLVYETHSVTVDNETGIATGWLPGELSARGRDLAVELGERRKAVDVVYASGLRRVVQTAEISFAGSGKEIRLGRRLRECDYGIYNGRPVSEVAALRSRHIDTPWPGGQSYRQVVAEVAGFLREVMEEWQGGLVLVVSHSANRWALQNLLDGAPLEELVDAPFEWRPGWEYGIA